MVNIKEIFPFLFHFLGVSGLQIDVIHLICVKTFPKGNPIKTCNSWEGLKIL